MAACVLMLSGCYPDWDRPDFSIPVAEHYREGGGKVAPPVSDRWVDSFHSAELSQLAEQTRSGNLDIAAAFARIQQADAQSMIAAAPLFPMLTMNDSASRTQSAGTLRGYTTPYTTSRQSFYGLGLSASYQLDFWGKYKDGSIAARMLADASRFDRSVVELASIASLANAYFAVLGAQDRLRIARDNVKIGQQVLSAVQQRIAVGTATDFDLAQQESVVATVRATIPTLEQIELQTKTLLAVLVGRTPESVHIKGGSLETLKAPTIKPGVPAQLLLRRPDLAEAEFKLHAGEFSVEQARAAFYPQLSISGQLGVQSLILKSLFRPEAIAYQLAGQLAQPIIDGHNLQGQLALQKGRFDELLQVYHKQILTAFSDVENALIAIKKTSERERLQAVAASASRRALDAALRRLDQGTIDIVTLSTTQVGLFQNLDVLSQVRLARFQAYVSLYQALGGGWSEPDRELARLQEMREFYTAPDPIP